MKIKNFGKWLENAIIYQAQIIRGCTPQMLDRAIDAHSDAVFEITKAGFEEDKLPVVIAKEVMEVIKPTILKQLGR